MCGAFLAVVFVRFTVAKLGLLAAGKGFRSLRRATGALPLDPATFKKVDETFHFPLFTFHISVANSPKMLYNVICGYRKNFVSFMSAGTTEKRVII